MKAIAVFLVFVCSLASCRESVQKPVAGSNLSKSVNTTAANYTTAKEPQLYKDTTVIVADTAFVNGEQYIALYKTNDTLYVVNSRKDTLVRLADMNASFAFDDFNGDGYKDLRIHQASIVPAVEDLLLFNQNANTFTLVQNFSDFPEPLPVTGTQYYYSYHRSGCGDMNWDSDLFFIYNFTAVRIGNIAGRECDDRDEKDGLYISTVKGGTKTLVKTLPIDVAWKHDAGKWGFIKAYWKKNYRLFR